MRALALAVTCCLLLSGCPGPPLVCSVADARAEPPAQEGWQDDSGPVSVLLPALMGFACSGEGPVASSATAEVLSPTNVSLPVTVEAQRDGIRATVAARVTFLPAEGPGLYLATATFLPVGGRPTSQILVVRDRREAPSTRLPRRCRTLAALPSGAWVCDGLLLGAGGADTRLFAPEWEVAAAGGTLWAHHGNTLMAWRELDGALQPLGEFATGYIFRALALEDRLVLFAPGRVQVVTFPNGGLQLEAELSPSLVAHAAVTAHAGRLYLPEPQPEMDNFGNQNHRVCTVALAPAQAAPETCTVLRGQVVGGWNGDYLTLEGVTLRAWAPTQDGKLLLTDTLLLPAGLFTAEPADALFSGHWPQLPDPMGAALVTRVRGGRIAVEHFASMPEGFISRRDLVFGALADGGTGAWTHTP